MVCPDGGDGGLVQMVVVVVADEDGVERWEGFDGARWGVRADGTKLLVGRTAGREDGVEETIDGPVSRGRELHQDAAMAQPRHLRLARRLWGLKVGLFDAQKPRSSCADGIRPGSARDVVVAGAFVWIIRGLCWWGNSDEVGCR